MSALITFSVKARQGGMVLLQTARASSWFIVGHVYEQVIHMLCCVSRAVLKPAVACMRIHVSFLYLKVPITSRFYVGIDRHV